MNLRSALTDVKTEPRLVNPRRLLAFSADGLLFYLDIFLKTFTFNPISKLNLSIIAYKQCNKWSEPKMDREAETIWKK